MLYGRYAFTCRFENDAHLPEYKGSTFRGVFGTALKRVVCALKRQECPECLLKQECLYPQVFEPRLTMPAAPGSRRAAMPHPYVIQPPATTQTHFPKDAAFDFNLLLFGPVNLRLPYFIYAFSEMGRIGVGRKIDGRRGAYRLETVTAGGTTLYTDKDCKLRNDIQPCDLKIAPVQHPPDTDIAVTLAFETPLRLKYNNRLTPELPFHVLVRAMLRRASSLIGRYDGAEPELDYTGMTQRAGAVHTQKSTLQWVEWRRYSHRQDQAMMMGGLKGTVTYSGPLGEYLPLLDFCAKVHLGKQTTFGLGRFTVEVGQ